MPINHRDPSHMLDHVDDVAGADVDPDKGSEDDDEHHDDDACLLACLLAGWMDGWMDGLID